MAEQMTLSELYMYVSIISFAVAAVIAVAVWCVNKYLKGGDK